LAGGSGPKPRGSRAKPRKPSVVLKLPSRTEFLGLVRDVTGKLAEVAGFPEATARGVGLAVDECATNVIKHAYGGAEDREIELRIEYMGSDFKVEVVDSGATVDPRSVPDVDLQRYASERRKGGLGVHLMGKIMDSVTYRRAARRNVCCMVKHRIPGETEQS
jgi:serine/threonine-protein kinase RsbW